MEVKTHMNRSQLRKLAKFQAEAAFLNDNIVDFTSTSRSGQLIADYNAAIGRITALAGEQSSQVIRQSFGIKSEALKRLLAFIGRINRAAKALDDEVEGTARLFKMPPKRVERVIIAAARSFYTDSLPYEAKFIDLDLPPTFRADLLSLTEAAERASAAADLAGGTRGGVTGELNGMFRDCTALSKKLGVVVENKYHGDRQKLSAWQIASHLETGMKKPDTEKALAPPTIKGLLK